MIDWTGWPLLEVHVVDVPAHEARAVVGKALDTALKRGESFAAVVRMPANARRGGRVRGAVEQVRMIRRLKPGLIEHCRGLAFVVPADMLDEHAKTIKSGPKIWGCPVTALADVDRARAWARDQLAVGAA